MTHKMDQHIETVPDDLLGQPIDYMFAEHYRQRQVCVYLDQIASGDIDPSLIVELISFFQTDSAQHIRDEEEFLFPLLRERCEKEDNIENILSELSSEHDSSEKLKSAVLTALQNTLDKQKIKTSEAGVIKKLSQYLRHHLILENAIILPIARARFTDQDLNTLSQQMIDARR